MEGTHTLPNVRRNFPEWHLGRSPYVLWALDVDCPSLRAESARAGRHLAPWLLEGYCRQPHITLALCGFPDPQPARDDEFSPRLLAQQCSILRLVAPTVVEIDIGGLASFSSAPYLRVQDRDGGVHAIHRCLHANGMPEHREDYVPHVTVGLYGGAWPLPEIEASLQAFPATDLVSCRIDSLSLMGYDPSEIGGALTCLAEYSLVTGALRWHQPLFAALDF